MPNYRTERRLNGKCNAWEERHEGTRDASTRTVDGCEIPRGLRGARSYGKQQRAE
jgi:hypothetical protein